MKNKPILFSAFFATELNASWSNPNKIKTEGLKKVNSNSCFSAGSESKYTQDITSYTQIITGESKGYTPGPLSDPIENPSGSGSSINYVFYKVHDGQYDFDTANNQCATLDGINSRLASIFSQEENDALKDLKPADKRMWIGLNDRETDTSFKWVNSNLQTLSFTKWASNEPNHFTGEDCVELWSSYSRRYDDEGGVRREWSQGAWNDDRCLKTIDTFACEVRVFAECNCKPGYSGSTCQNHICNVNNPCSGTADCVVDSNELGYKCNCKPGFSGESCEVSPCVKNRFSESSN